MGQKPPFQPPDRPDELDNTRPIPRPVDPSDGLIVALQAAREKRANMPPPQTPDIMGAPSDDHLIDVVMEWGREHRSKLLWSAVVVAGIVVLLQFVGKKSQIPLPQVPAAAVSKPAPFPPPAAPVAQSQPARPPVANPLKAGTTNLTNPFQSPLFQPKNPAADRSRELERQREVERQRERERERQLDLDREREREERERELSGRAAGDAHGQGGSSGEPATPQTPPDGLQAPPPPPNGQ